MRVIRPVEITPSQLLSTTATESYAAWDIGTTYADGDIRVYEQSLYESLQNRTQAINQIFLKHFG